MSLRTDVSNSTMTAKPENVRLVEMNEAMLAMSGFDHPMSELSCGDMVTNC